MTLEEKAAPNDVHLAGKNDQAVGCRSNFDFKKAKAAFKKGHGIGQVGRPSDAGSTPSDAGIGKNAKQTAELANAIQKFFIEHSRLGIPVIFHEECLHATRRSARRVFHSPSDSAPRSILSWLKSCSRMTAEGDACARCASGAHAGGGCGARRALGRVEETYGEDPFSHISARIAAVRGFQGDATFKDKKRVIATLKHFASARPAGIRPKLRAGERVRARACVKLFASVQRRDRKRRCDQCDGELQRD